MTGQGQSIFTAAPAATNVLYVAVNVVTFTNPKIRVTGTAFPRRLQYAGSLQLMTYDFAPDGSIILVPVFDWPITWEAFEFDVPATNLAGNGCNAMGWLLPPGIEVKAQVNY